MIFRTVRKIAIGILMAILVYSSKSSAEESDFHTPPDQWKEPRIYHTPFDDQFEKKIRISKNVWPAKNLESIYSPNKAYRFCVLRLDFLTDSPWSTRILIDNEREHPVTIEIFDHSNAQVEIRWLNEKLLYLSWWWGRILGTYMIFDVEKEAVLQKEMIHDGAIAFEQFKEVKHSL